jgi:HlyD family secretion protein
MRRIKKTFSLLLLLVLAVGCQQKQGGINGYVEGEYLYIAPTSGGVLAHLFVDRGQAVQAGQPLFSLDLKKPEAAYAAAGANLAQATAHWNDLAKGKRPEEIDVILKQKAQAEAMLQNAKVQLQRSLPLAKQGYVSQAQRDADQAGYDAAKARVDEIKAELKAAALPAREDELVGAKAAIDAARQALVQTEKLLQEAAPKAPAAGRVEDVFYRAGEFVAAGSPVISFLPPENVKVRFFVSEKMLPSIRRLQPVKIDCDGCKTPVPGKITFIASQAEFTPPVIYSVESRDKLVFMVEATPDTPDSRLQPGLPVDIEFPAP